LKHVYEVRPRKDKRSVDLISDVASSIRSQRSPLEQRGARQKNWGNCDKQADESDDDYNLSKTEHPARKHSKSGTHCYLRQGTESQSYKQIGPNPFFQCIDSRHDATGNVIETHEHKGDFKEWQASDSFTGCSVPLVVRLASIARENYTRRWNGEQITEWKRQLKLPGKYLAIREVGSLNKKTKGQKTKGRFFRPLCPRVHNLAEWRTGAKIKFPV
jgi:hypothetical protein